jgi:catechol 2,3-dioxygenase-like lactoylglutathione lyase family enzyme
MAKLRHVGILVHDLDMSIKLYTDVFGFKVLNKGIIMGKYAEELFNISNLHLTYVKLKSKGCSTRLELWKIKDFLPPQNTSFSHISFTVKDLNNIYEQLKERKLAFFSPPIKARDSQVRLCFCRDYDNNILELVEDKRIKS